MKKLKIKISSLLEDEANKDRKILKKKIDMDKFYEKEIKEELKSLRQKVKEIKQVSLSYVLPLQNS